MEHACLLTSRKERTRKNRKRGKKEREEDDKSVRREGSENRTNFYFLNFAANQLIYVRN
jgi:hypothetical protein